jgi:hypothetical protein
MKRRSSLAPCFPIVVLSIFWSINCTAQINSWTKTVSGYWEEPFWSLGVLPSLTQSGVTFNNPGFKALAIGASTVSSHPESLTNNNLTVSSPAGSLNTLLLNYPGLATPLHVVDTFYLGSNARLVSLYGGLRVGTFSIDGLAIQAEFAETFARQATLGQTAPASYTMTNGLFAGDVLQIGAGASGAFSQYGGRNTVVDTFLRANGSIYDLYAGVLAGRSLNVSYNDSLTFSGGTSRVNQWGGSVQMSGSIGVGSTLDSGSYFLAHGDLNAGSERVGGSPGNGSFYQASGTNTCVSLGVGGRRRAASGDYFLTNGIVMISDTLSIAAEDAGARGNFYQYGGLLLSGRVSLTGFDNGYDAPGFAGYSLVSGMVLSGNVTLGNFSGFSQSGGTNSLSDGLGFSGFSGYNLSGGSLTCRNVLSSSPILTDLGVLAPSIMQTGGRFHVSETFRLGAFGTCNLQGGTLDAYNIALSSARLIHTGGIITNYGTFGLTGSALFQTVGQSQRLGKLLLNDPPVTGLFTNYEVIAFGGSGAGILQFADSHDLPWTMNAALVVQNWNGSISGGGASQIFVGDSSTGLTRAQVSQIVFESPAGLPPGHYPAKLLSTGELVPSTIPTLAFVRSRFAVLFFWPSPFVLQTATAAAGPYVDVIGASSPYPMLLDAPQRFFRLRR